MDLKKLREQSKNEINVERQKMQKEIEDVRRAVLEGKEKNTGKLRKLRRNYARVCTVLNEKREEKVAEEVKGEQNA